MNGFRKSFKFGTDVGVLNWFPKHMNSGIKQMQAKLRTVDCILEVHDARIPMSGRNPNLARQLVGGKPHILVMNKSDLISHSKKTIIQNFFEKSKLVNRVIFTNCKNDRDPGIRKLVPMMQELIQNSSRYHRSHIREYHAMIIGIPNVGKSSLINMLRSKHLKKGRAVKVGPSAGVTKCVHEKVKISENPIIFLFDTPGILQPRVSTVTSGMKLAACANLPDAQVGVINIADFVLYTLNKSKDLTYVEQIGLDVPTDCIVTVLSNICTRRNFISACRSSETNLLEPKPDLSLAAEHFLKAFRQGQYGKIILDDLDAEIQTTNNFEGSNRIGDIVNFQLNTALSI